MNNRGYNSGSDNTPSSLIRYEENSEKGESLYLDSGDFADIISYYSSNEQYDDALEAAQIGLNFHPGNEYILIEQAYAYLYLTDFKQANKMASKLLKEHKSNDTLLLQIEIILNDPKITDKSLVNNFIAELVNMDDIDTIIDVCYVLMSGDTIPRDIIDPWIEKGKKLDLSHEQFLEVYIEYLRKTEQFELGIKAAEKLIDTDPYSTKHWWTKAFFCYLSNKIDECIEALEFAIVTDSESPECYFLLGQAYMNKQDYDKAIELFKTALDKDFDDLATLYIHMAHCYYELNDELFTEYFFLANEEGADVDSLIDFFLDDENLNYVIENFDEETIMELPYKARFKLTAMTRNLTDSNEEDDEDEDDEEDEESWFDNENYHLINAIIHFEDEEEEEALEEAEQAELEVNTIQAHFEIAKLFCRLGELDKSYLYFKKVYDEDPQYELVGFDLYILSAALGKVAGAEYFNNELSKKVDINDILAISEYLTETNKRHLINALDRYNNIS